MVQNCVIAWNFQINKKSTTDVNILLIQRDTSSIDKYNYYFICMYTYMYARTHARTHTHTYIHTYQARSQGGVGGGVVRPPPVAHPKDFVPPFSNFVPPLEYVDDVTRAMSKGGGACECPRVGGVFQIDDVTRTMSKGGGGCL